MADNIDVTPGTGKTIAADEIASALHQRVKLSLGADGTANDAVAGAGAVSTGVQRMTLASDDPAVAALVAIRDATSTVAVSGPVTDTQLRATPLSVTSGGYDVATAITRPANVTAYTAGDVVGGAIDLGTLGPSAGSIVITGAQLLLNLTSAAAVPTGMTSFRLYLYSVTPPSAYADNAQWGLPTSGISLSGDRASFLGFIDLGSPVNLGITGSFTPYCEVNGVNKQVKLAGTKLFGYLVTNGGYTPAANSEVYTLTMHTVAV